MDRSDKLMLEMIISSINNCQAYISDAMNDLKKGGEDAMNANAVIKHYSRELYELHQRKDELIYKSECESNVR
jgi:cellobiose-specific phosphotransferase system component IIA